MKDYKGQTAEQESSSLKERVFGDLSFSTNYFDIMRTNWRKNPILEELTHIME